MCAVFKSSHPHKKFGITVHLPITPGLWGQRQEGQWGALALQVHERHSSKGLRWRVVEQDT